MAKGKWIEDRFRKELRREREEREWSQEKLADMLSERGVPMHWTTVAKIEKGTRSVRIDEAAEIAALLGVSLDSLLGRGTDAGADEKFAIRAFLDAVREAIQQISSTVGTLHSRVTDLDRFDFDGRDYLLDGGLQATAGLMGALSALVGLSVYDLPDRAADLTPLKAALDREGSELLAATLDKIEPFPTPRSTTRKRRQR
jgi:transcriptional regulator with XRE-family HTH domain